jgi:hypothetical protein
VLGDGTLDELAQDRCWGLAVHLAETAKGAKLRRDQSQSPGKERDKPAPIGGADPVLTKGCTQCGEREVP